jgi:hypothetical protein
MATTAITGASEGFVIDDDAMEPAGDEGPATPEEELALRIISRLRQNQPKAALATAVELAKVIGINNDLDWVTYF